MATGQPPKFRLTSDWCGQKPPGTVPDWDSISGCHDCACVGAPLVGGQYTTQEVPSCSRGPTLKQERDLWWWVSAAWRTGSSGSMLRVTAGKS